MSKRELRERAELFAALGDATRLQMVARLERGERCSIAELTAETKLTRQAVRKHLRVLERVRVVHARAEGRERMYELDVRPMEEMRVYLERVAGHWDRALGRLQAMVEE
ncbi:MAG: metalloregulator ArsR/SmtB family transcription factor [Acidobacteriota bacterium]